LKTLTPPEPIKQSLTLMRLSALSGLLGAAAWAASDALLLGQRGDPRLMGALSESAFLNDRELAAMVAAGSAGAQEAGAVLAVLACPLMVLALYLVLGMLRPASRAWRAAAAGPLLAGFCWSPVVLATYYSLGQAVRIALSVEKASTESVLALAGSFEHLLMELWLPAVGAMTLGWLVLAFLTVRGKTLYPRFFAVLNPLPMAVAFFAAVRLLPADLSAALGASGISLGLAAFFLASLISLLGRRQPEGQGVSAEPR
jgi:hypothetical protein